ncbi:MAG: dihydrolipoyl dehydrogenase [Candidatus Atabeyarchaeum deiterrae]
MKEYDLIVIGSGSAMAIADAAAQQDPTTKIAVIDKDDPGGICLTRGCIPSKLLLYPAELVRIIERAGELGVQAEIRKVDFQKVMERMRTHIGSEIEGIRGALADSRNADYYPVAGEFTSPYTLKVGNETITAKMIILCTGSKPVIPPIKGLDKVGYQNSDTLLKMSKLPESIAVIGGGFIAAEYGHFFSAMGSKVTVIGRSPKFLPEEEPEVGALAKREFQKHMKIFTNHEVSEVDKGAGGKKKLIAIDRDTGKKIEILAEEILVAAGRGSNSDILHPEKAGIKTDKNGWIEVNEYLETSQPNIWALGDADGRYPFKHKANYEASIVFYNAVLKNKVKVDYHAIPHAVFTYPEIASVGLREEEAIEKYGKDKVLIGLHRYEDTAKGEAMGVKDYFVKVIVEAETMKILGAHIIGPSASILIQELITLMYTPQQDSSPIVQGMHIHPALTEVVERAFRPLMSPDEYHHMMEEHYKLPTK